MEVAIWAPHPDDEIIGCFGVLSRIANYPEQRPPTVYFATGFDEIGPLLSSERFGFLFEPLPAPVSSVNWYTVYAPDPAVDHHPLHQQLGHRAQHLFRIGRINRLIHYTTTMSSAPYIFETKDPEAKRAALDACYPYKSDLWKYDHRYFLFEGNIEWLRPD